ncbi:MULTISPECIES: crotonase/enoyl-CoA hydratase family protein [unclassified Mycobacterium]|uniref:crotonase/enoyl-CoA hydratase family protein n=1 Tax=unclassified Mycobacterium TaxID=2642494 RepID=UPI00048EE39E|nr:MULTISPECIES: crotonase/enoyl-CoA hydratase family protein [unclassified Mycobacterium]SEA60083.1 crotonobetainyl-CoA hydratase [Mycobacterium sp. 283mftsu]
MTADAPPALLNRVGHVAVITLNRPHAMNAITAEMSLAVQDAIDELLTDPDLRVGILTGAGDRAFSAGADLKEVAAGRPLVDRSQRERGFGGFLKSGLGKPLIAAVNGYALGGGTELLLACDLAVMSETATLGLPEVTRGIIAAGGGLLRLSKRIPLSIALEMSLTGAPMSASEALRWGLVNRVVPQEQVLDAALELAGVIAANAPLAVQASKRVTYASRDAGSDFEADAWALSDAEAKTVMRTADAKEGPRAFVEKRAPVWSGS